ncbi:hypothetical protein IQ07DRAFT_671067 [Pyrenochaeta sp. DS3sAY3a]|nr:hypothetical protein IQ07DRAFT_671067 [Pyrenochaeta sp. DS3sAY3a]
MLQSRWATKPDSAAPEQKDAPTSTAATATAAAPIEAPPTTAAPDAQAVQRDAAPVPASYDAPVVTTTSYDPAYDDPSIDPFAQTASTDDLFFDDDITPIAEPVVEQNHSDLDSAAPEFVPEDPQPPIAPQSHLKPHTPREPRNAERGGRGRGRGGRGRGRGRGGHTSDIRETGEKTVTSETPRNSNASPANTAAASTAPADSGDAPSTPSAPADPKDRPTHSVRGDRTLTGGNARTRLTEEELNAKLANMRSKNEALQTAHARAEADLAKYEAREAMLKKQDVERKKVVAEKQKAERANRQQMMGEREKNRQRKLNAQGGREWDFEKEEGFSGTGEEKRRGATRGAHGGITPDRSNAGAVSGEPAEDPNIQQSTRGRGRGRGGRGSRGGRGDHDGSRQPEQKKSESQKPPSASDFPELPSSTVATASKDTDTPKTLDFPIRGKTSELKNSEPERPGIKKQESFGLPSPMEKGRSWADEVGS